MYQTQYLSFRTEILWGFQASKIDNPWRLDRKRAGDNLEKNDIALRTQHTLVRTNEVQDAIKASRKHSSLSGKESAQGCIPKRLLYDTVLLQKTYISTYFH